MKRQVVAFALIVVPAALLGHAQEPSQPPPPPALQWSLGLGVISAPRPYVGADNRILAIPLIGLEYKRLYVQGIRVGYHLVENDDLAIDIRARYIFDGLDPDDSPFLDGMAARDGTVEGGLGVDWTPGAWGVRLSAFSDLLGRSDGRELGLDVSRTWTFGRYRWGLTPAVGAVWQSSDLIDYYYGVPPEEARPGRPAYAGQSALNFRTSLLAFYRLSSRVSLIGLVQAQRLDDEISDSPIVDRRRSYFALVGIDYQFGRQTFRGP
jgi:outer membrane protein